MTSPTLVRVEQGGALLTPRGTWFGWPWPLYLRARLVAEPTALRGTNGDLIKALAPMGRLAGR